MERSLALCLCSDGVTVSMATASLKPQRVIARLWVKLKSHTAEKQDCEHRGGNPTAGVLYTSQGSAWPSGGNLLPDYSRFTLVHLRRGHGVLAGCFSISEFYSVYPL